MFFKKVQAVETVVCREESAEVQMRRGNSSVCSCDNKAECEQRQPSLSPILQFNQVFHSQVSKDYTNVH